MEYLPIIILAVVAVIVTVLKIATKSISETEEPAENFPFPKEVLEPKGTDLWSWGSSSEEPQAKVVVKSNSGEGKQPLSLTEEAEARRAEVLGLDGTVYYEESCSEFEDIEMMTVERIGKKSSVEGASEGLLADFDIKKAVIYSEILAPKFNS